MSKIKKWQAPVFITFLLLGLLITVQFRTQQDYLRDLPQQSSDDLVLLFRKNNEKNEELEKILAELESQQNLFNTNISEDEALIKQMNQEISTQQIALGLKSVEGPGVTIVIPANQPIMYYDIIDIINELWNCRAEAIAVNDQRITSWSKIYWTEQTELTIDGQAVTFPCTIKAIGEPTKLLSGLNLAGGVLSNLATYNIKATVNEEEELSLPAADVPTVKYIRPIN
ncbi:MAG: DUF881 domain-containing protein [Syntrophaceticus sp.]